MKELFHITSMKNYSKIKIEGLIPKIGKNSKKYGETIPAIYLFKNKETAIDAVCNWLGDCFDDEEELVILKIEVPNHISILSSHAKYEYIVTEKIITEYIFKIEHKL